MTAANANTQQNIKFLIGHNMLAQDKEMVAELTERDWDEIERAVNYGVEFPTVLTREVMARLREQMWTVDDAFWFTQDGENHE